MPIDCYYSAPAPEWKSSKAPLGKCGEYMPEPYVSEKEINEWFFEWGSSSPNEQTLEEKFIDLSAEWEREVGHISSVRDLTSHPSYQKIIQLGWAVVPLLLLDLKRKQRFWFPALHAITGIRPFDQHDAGNGKRMTEAWTKWGQRKGLI